jgi:hypothetical protein
MMLRKMLGSKREEVAEDWRKLHVELLMCIHCKYDFGDQTKKDEMSKGVTERCVQGLGWET